MQITPDICKILAINDNHDKASRFLMKENATKYGTIIRIQIVIETLKEEIDATT